ncbi:MAG: hypothetical protein COB02_17385 [Candidatus Cloacimonadota bacterium]|nr:MAG: hypothetical protein COB02_17385 [Candidatus Cloacimonadota bacterium]
MKIFPKQKKSPVQFYLLIAILFITLITIYLGSQYGYFKVYLFAINLVTTLVYGYDKLTAKYIWFRVPENVLLILGLFGGSIGGFIGQVLFRHKTSKKSFQLSFRLIIGFQLFLIIWRYY